MPAAPLGKSTLFGCPISGEVAPVSQCPDPTFAQEILGPGVVIFPEAVSYTHLDVYKRQVVGGDVGLALRHVDQQGVNGLALGHVELYKMCIRDRYQGALGVLVSSR